MTATRTILLTGATGFLGGAVLAEGLSTRLAERWVCIVRGKSDIEAHARVRKNLALFLGEDAVDAALERVEIVRGDITDSSVLAGARFDAVTEILHLAADTSYRSRENNRLVNVGGTRAIAERARRMPGLRRFIYSGTAMICGRNAGPVVREDDSPSPNAEHVVYYTKTKAEAETMLRTEFADLPVVVLRPSIVAGHSVLGAIPSASIFWMCRTIDALRIVSGDPDGGIDVVPVDWAARTILGFLVRPKLKYATYHLSGGTAKPTRWKELAARFEQLDPSDGVRAYEQVGCTEWKRLRNRFEDVFGLTRAIDLAMLRAVRAYYEFCALGFAFDNSRLVEEGFALPLAMPDYLSVCLANPSNRSIVAQFADDLGMFEADIAALEAASAPAMQVA
ncbi:MAG: SDR family oxidoreductase [Proteobacteria bacterium]|nr:SDR family oxidoreductase [Pseudomonadota bacterium]